MLLLKVTDGEWCLSLYHSIRPRQHVGRDCEADLLGGFQIDHQLELSWLLDGQVSRVSALQDLVNIHGRASPQVRSVRSIAHQAPSVHELGR